MTEAKTYQGGCHCGKVHFEAQTDLTNVLACNCSICAKRGSLLTFIPESQFRLLSDEKAMTDYQFNKKIIHHLFCATCGIFSFGRGKGPDGEDMVALNVRCLEGVDLGALSVTPHDGKSL